MPVQDTEMHPSVHSAARHSKSSRKSGLPLMPAMLCTLCLLAGLMLAWHYPLGAPWAVGGFTIMAFVAGRFPLAWLVILPALLPMIGFAPWSGWITFEEVDMLVLAMAAGGYWRLAWLPTREPPLGATARAPSTLSWTILLLFAASLLLAMVRGFDDAGGFLFGWFQGYHEPMNSVRLAKSFALACLLLPLWRQAQRQQAGAAANMLSLGLTAGLVGASLATVWERSAFTGLFNFSSDYRTTAMFWEMHVGGAALDGFLALTIPFAMRELYVAKTSLRWGLSAVALLAGGYACLVTFSRGVYLAVPVGAAIFFTLYALQQKRAARADTSQQVASQNGSGLLAGTLLIVGFAIAAGSLFPTSGYRGAGLLLGAVGLMLPLAQVLQRMPLRHWLAGGVAGLLLVGLESAVSWLVPKGAYIAFASGFIFTSAMYVAWFKNKWATTFTGPLVFAGFVATLAAVVLVAHHWGYSKAVGPAAAAVAACLLLVLAAGTVRRPLWPDSMRWQATTVCLMGLAIAIIGVFGGGTYMGDRFSTGSSDLRGRIDHWKLGASMLQTPSDWWFGKGLGRFPANDFLVGDAKQRPGDYRLRREGDNNYLRLTGGLNGADELFRVTQRVALPARPSRVLAQIRTANEIDLHFEVCEKHLLYQLGCLTGAARVNAAAGKWQAIEVQLGGDATRGLWYAPRLLAFSVAVSNNGGSADLDQLELKAPDGRDLLVNGDFSNDLAHWFFSSDRNHLPWHIKNIFMHLLFDQGIVGLALCSLLLIGALVRLASGKANAHPLAPAMAASLAGFAIVGLFDSLLDVPRVALLFYVLLLFSLAIRRQPHPVSAELVKGKA